MTDTSGLANLQSKQDIICESENLQRQHIMWLTKYHFSVHNIPFESNASIKPEKCFTQKKKKK